MSALRRLAALAAAAGIATGCSGGPILANPPQAFPSPPTASPGPSTSSDPIPIALPRDDGPHDRLTEWWYYTGHLRTDDGRTFGFEFVVFRAERGTTPVAWASHLALTDEHASTFYYAQRSEVGPQVDMVPAAGGAQPDGFNLSIAGLSPALIQAGAPARATPWHMEGASGDDRLDAAFAPAEATAAGAAVELGLALKSEKPAVMHHGNGFIDFGPAGSSYYYSRTRLAVTGLLRLNGAPMQVTGIAWFDHQWGDFVSVGAGGWNWFAINLDDGTDITMSEVLDEHASSVLEYGTLVRPSGEVVPLRTPDDFGVGSSGFGGWQSPTTGVVYPNTWEVVFKPSLMPQLPVVDGAALLDLKPTVANQELDTRATTGVAYWEGSELVTSPDPSGNTVRQLGRAYVEITRYGTPGG